MFHLEDSVKHDRIGRVVDASLKYHAMVMQFKVKMSITFSEVLETIFATDLDSSYTVTQTHEPNKQMKKRKTEAQALLQKFETGSLRILFLYPFEVYNDLNPKQWDDLHSSLGDDMFVFLERRTTPKLFTDDIWKFLSHLKSVVPEQPI